MKINLNQKVKVKVTSVGKSHFIHRHKDLFGDSSYAPKFQFLQEDEEGYSVWQLWDLIGHFGEALQLLTLHPPIETEIELIE
ncbi:MAG: hypothetical protein V7K40_24500 [Nostoc sp.]|uniref:hypothetical protein n=1 Tax=Nostoc sp. TaxID=1180 RepID=UPI002FF61E8E